MKLFSLVLFAITLCSHSVQSASLMERIFYPLSWLQNTNRQRFFGFENSTLWRSLYKPFASSPTSLNKILDSNDIELVTISNLPESQVSDEITAIPVKEASEPIDIEPPQTTLSDTTTSPNIAFTTLRILKEMRETRKEADISYTESSVSSHPSQQDSYTSTESPEAIDDVSTTVWSSQAPNSTRSSSNTPSIRRTPTTTASTLPTFNITAYPINTTSTSTSGPSTTPPTSTTELPTTAYIDHKSRLDETLMNLDFSKTESWPTLPKVISSIREDPVEIGSQQAIRDRLDRPIFLYSSPIADHINRQYIEGRSARVFA